MAVEDCDISGKSFPEELSESFEPEEEKTNFDASHSELSEELSNKHSASQYFPPRSSMDTKSLKFGHQPASSRGEARLVIHKMVLTNFKSYAGRQEIGPFHKSFSAIVGPNGSGKSNTIDALLFVFGYRASKMRQGKLSELIHNSARYPDLTHCSVEVHFREIIDEPGPDAYGIIPNSDLIVARVAFRNNSSKYTINRSTSNFTEVTTLLKQRGIDLDHKRFLILQGEVESIAQMKPKAPSEHEDGLLEYLEDIIGTSKYKEPIEKTLVEVDKYNEDRALKLNRLRIVEKEKNSLEDAKRETENYIRLQNDLARAHSRLYQWHIWQARTENHILQTTITDHEDQLTAEVEKNKDDIAHAEQLQEHYEERVATYEEIKQTSDELVKLLAGHEREEVSLSEKKKHATGKAKKLKKNLQEDQHKISENERTAREHTKRIESERARISELEQSLDEAERMLETIRDSLKDKTQVYHDQIETKQKELAPWTAKINDIQSALDVAKGERNLLSAKAEGLTQAAQKASEQLENLKKLRVTKEAEISRLKNEKAGFQHTFEQLQANTEGLHKALGVAKAKLASHRSKVEDARTAQSSNQSQNSVLDALTRLKNSGRITGFHGRLGSLGTIPDEYDVAVSTACGTLNYLVVDTVEEGQTCIEYLRRQNIGRASFMVLEKLSAEGCSKIVTPENVPRLFDLINPKESRFAAAFYKGVGNTLVAKDLDQANRIAFGGQRRWRVVTLAGQLIDASGTMSGGGTKVMKGGMSSKLVSEAVDPASLKRFEKECEDTNLQVEDLVSQVKAADEALDELKGKKPSLDVELQKAELEISALSKRESEASKNLKELRSQNEPNAVDVARTKSLDKEIADADAAMESLLANTRDIENSIKALEQKILDIGGSKMLAQKSKVDGIRLHINLANDEITRAEVAKAKCEKDQQKLAALIKTSKEALIQVDEILLGIDEQLSECQTTLNNIRTKVEQAQVATDHAKEDLDDLKCELDEQMKIIQKFRTKEMDIQQKLNEARKEHSECQRVMDHYSALHDSLVLEEVDEGDDSGQVEEESGAANQASEEARDSNQNGCNEAATSLVSYSEDELATFNKRTLVADVGFLEEKVQNVKVDLQVLKEYRKREKEFLARAHDLEQVTNLRDECKKKYDNLRKSRLDEFMTGFNMISAKLKEMYQMITLGGNAELELVDSMDPFSEGIIFSVMPPKKSWKNISNLSGGEKTLSSLALVFALHVYKPTPLYFMDEIDAALDFRNVSIVANYIKDRTKNAQFIIISLRNDMFELSHRLVGIYKTANATQSIAIDNKPLNAVTCN